VVGVTVDHRLHDAGAYPPADWLRAPPPWLRCTAASYPILAPLPGWDVDPRFRPAEVVSGAGASPIVLTRVGHEDPHVAATPSIGALDLVPTALT
jgi:hypothetical protein